MAVVIIRMGASISSGSPTTSPNSSLDAQFKTTFTNIKTWTGAAWASLDYATQNNSYPTETAYGGSEFAICKGLQEHYGGTIYDIKYQVTSTYLGSAISAANWKATTSNSYYQLAKATINKALIDLWVNQGVKEPLKIFIFFDLGGADAQNATDAGNYETNLGAFIDGFLTKFGTACTTYWFEPQICQNIFQINTTSRAVIDATNTSPIEYTTNGAHALTTGQGITAINIGGNTGANTSGIITVTGTTTFTIAGSVGNGVYTTGGNIDALYWKSTVQAAQIAACAARQRCYTYSTDSYELGSDGTHFSNLGFKEKGDAAVALIIANGL